MSNVARPNVASPGGELRLGVVGCGHMGRLHARVISQMPGVKLAGVCDINPEAAAAVAAQYECEVFRSIEEMLPVVSAVVIAVPTQQHLAVAEPFVSRRIPCLIEKPLAKDVAEACRIVDLAGRNSAIVQVGHIERFNPAMRAMARLNVRPQFIEVTRISPMTFRSIDVGVVLDMMIHDIDVVLDLTRSTVSRIDAVGVSVIGDVEDVCNARLTFANGCVANLTASRLALKTERRMRVFSRDAYVSIDYQKRYGIVAHRSCNLEAIRQAVARIRAGQITDLSQLNYSDLVKVEELAIDDVEPLRAELESFVQCVREGTQPAVSARAGLAAVEVACRIVDSISPGMVL